MNNSFHRNIHKDLNQSLVLLGEQLKAVRQSKGLSQEVLADKILAKTCTIGRLERGYSVKTETLVRVIDYLGLKVCLVPDKPVDTVMAIREHMLAIDSLIEQLH